MMPMSSNDPLQTFAGPSIILKMTKAVPELSWVAPFTLAALRERSDLRLTMEAYWRDALSWRWAEREDWPPETVLAGDFAHAKKGGYGFIAGVGSKQLFAVPRGWEEPEWELAEVSAAGGKWRDLGYFEPWSPTWVRPELAGHPSHGAG